MRASGCVPHIELVSSDDIYIEHNQSGSAPMTSPEETRLWNYKTETSFAKVVEKWFGHAIPIAMHAKEAVVLLT